MRWAPLPFLEDRLAEGEVFDVLEDLAVEVCTFFAIVNDHKQSDIEALMPWSFGGPSLNTQLMRG